MSEELVKRYKLECELWPREHTGEWVLEISGGIGGTYLCSRHTEPLTTAADDAVGLPSLYSELEALTARIAQLEAERDAARDALKIANEPHWFYYGDDCSSDRCRDSIYECIDEDFEWDNRPEGDHVLLISGARPVPDIWVALHYYTEAEKDARDSDDEYTFTEHKTKEEAEAAIRALATQENTDGA